MLLCFSNKWYTHYQHHNDIFQKLNNFNRLHQAEKNPLPKASGALLCSQQADRTGDVFRHTNNAWWFPKFFAIMNVFPSFLGEGVYRGFNITFRGGLYKYLELIVLQMMSFEMFKESLISS